LEINGGVGRMDLAFFPYSIALSNVVVWETSLTTLFADPAGFANAEARHSKSLRAWVGYGLLWGASASPSPAAFSRHCPFWALGSGSVKWKRRVLHWSGHAASLHFYWS